MIQKGGRAMNRLTSVIAVILAVTLVLAVANVYAGQDPLIVIKLGQATHPYQRGYVPGPGQHPSANLRSGMRTVIKLEQATHPYQRGYVSGPGQHPSANLRSGMRIVIKLE